MAANPYSVQELRKWLKQQCDAVSYNNSVFTIQYSYVWNGSRIKATKTKTLAEVISEYKIATADKRKHIAEIRKINWVENQKEPKSEYQTRLEDFNLKYKLINN